MGKLTSTSQDLADRSVEQVLSAAAGPTSYTPWLDFEGTFNFSMWGTGTGTVIIERSFDGGVTAIPLTNLGQAVSFTGPASENIFGRERGVLWRARRTVATAGNVSVRLSQ